MELLPHSSVMVHSVRYRLSWRYRSVKCARLPGDLYTRMLPVSRNKYSVPSGPRDWREHILANSLIITTRYVSPESSHVHR